MFLHYLNIISRHILRNKWLSFLKLFSLTLGLCSFIVVMVINHSERTWDQHWEDSENIYVLKNGFGIGSAQYFSEALASNRLKNESLSGMNSRAAHPSNPDRSLSDGSNIISLGITDAKFFEIFKPKVIAGNLSGFSNTPDAIVISQQVSESLFGKDSAIGKQMSIPASEIAHENYSDSESSFKLFKVIAVVANPSPRSSIEKSAYIKNAPYKNVSSTNQYLNTHIFVKLNGRITKIQYQQHLDKMFDAHYQTSGPKLSGQQISDLPKHKPELLSITDIHLDRDLNPGKNTTLWILYLIAFAVLLVSLVNYINMIMSSQLQRQKEIALYRLVGSSYINLFFLFLTEAMAFLIIAFGFTLAITQPVLPWLFKLLSIESDFSILHFGHIWFYLAPLLLIISLLLAVFPLIPIKNTMPSRILSANQYTERKNTQFIRYFFLCFQFFSAACFGIAAGIVSLQIHTALNQDTGYSYKNVHQFHFQGFVNPAQKTTLVQELKRNPNILSVSQMAAGISTNDQITMISAIDAPKDKAIGLHTIHISDFDIFNTYNIKIIAGVLPEKSKKSIKAMGDAVLCEQSLQALGFPTAESAVNQQVNFYFSDAESPAPVRITAVSNKITSGGLISKSENCIFWNSITPEAPLPYSVRYKENTLNETLQFIKKTAQQIVGTAPIDWSLKDEIESSIKQEKLINQFLYAFLIIILVICLLGVYGVSSLDAQKRKKEIALRKLHGADRFDIIRLLSKRYLLFILIAQAAATPISIYFISDWLEQFPNPINLIAWGLALTLISILLMIIMTSLIAALQTFRIVKARPAETLKAE